ncbi:MAG: nitrogenase [Methanobrevibacter sp.]|jgi:nitrogenase molybdenum-iron protein beta chain|nr:nitrogenase [Candidatus Methanovirga meridionalis]
MSHIIENPRFSCALGGALNTITAIDGFVPIIHGGPGCGVQVFYGQNFTSGFRGSGWIGGVAVPSSNTYEEEIVFGGESRLKEQIEKTFEIIDGDRYIVITACTSELIGDDIKGVLREVQQNNKNSIIYAETAGFKGSSYKGYEILLDAIIEQVLEVKEKNPKLVNLIGIIPSQDVFWKGNLDEIEKILNDIGLEVNTLVNGKNLEDLSSASLNIVLSPWLGIEAAKKLEDKYDIPYIVNPLPIGTQQSNEFIKRIGEFFKIDVNEYIAKKEVKTYKSIESVADFIVDMDVQPKFATITDSNYAIAINKFLVKELGWIPSTVLIIDDVPEDRKDFIKNELNFKDLPSPEVVFESDSYEIWETIEKNPPEFIFGSSLDKDFANKRNIPILTVSFPITSKVIIEKSYAGYNGSIRLIEDTLSETTVFF